MSVTSEEGIHRRGFLKAAVAAGLVTAAAACSGSGPGSEPSVAPSSRAAASPSGGPSRQAGGSWGALRQELTGDLLLPGQDGFSAGQRLYDPRFDTIRPAALVLAASADDVAATLRYAGQHHLPVRPRSGGHSYVGASTVADGIQLDVTKLATVRYDAASQTVTVGPGTELFDVHVALDPYARTVPTGTCATVGAAGLTLGGGMGVEGAAYGLTCDNLVGATVVTADGRVRTVDAHHQPDLYWACRGGGGGNMGVVTSLRLATSPADTTGFFYLTYADGLATKAVTGWQQRVPRMPRTGWANLHVEASGGGVQVRIVGTSLTGDAHTEASAMVAAIGVSPTASTITTHTHLDAVRILAGCSSLSNSACRLVPEGSLPRAAFVAGSDVLGRALSTNEASALVGFIRARGQANEAGVVILDPVAGRARDLAVAATAFPWRSALAVAQWYVGLPGPGSAAADAAARWVAQGHQVVAGASVGGYVNYLEPGRSVGSYYGPNFARLRDIRRRYDPDNMFASAYSIPL